MNVNATKKTEAVAGEMQPGEASANAHDHLFRAAVKMFEAGEVTTSQAAGMCGMASVDFVLAAERANQPRGATLSM